ncbi:MAG: DUF1311 domain-containing protein [Bacteroidetes bacterium]|nr:DUF1311 domain-containing protein [Bacteroidota bacterium]
MRKLFFIVFAHLLSQVLFGQTFESTTITKEVLQRLTKEVDKEAEDYKKTISRNDNKSVLIEFSVDTFRIERLAEKRSKLDYSTSDMSITIYQMKDSYDKLLNKYYQKLLNLLKTEDKEILIKAQKAWLSYRDNESKLIWTLKKKEYSGGGTIQRILANDEQLDFLSDRVIVLFNYYINVINGEQ